MHSNARGVLFGRTSGNGLPEPSIGKTATSVPRGSGLPRIAMGCFGLVLMYTDPPGACTPASLEVPLSVDEIPS